MAQSIKCLLCTYWGHECGSIALTLIIFLKKNPCVIICAFNSSVEEETGGYLGLGSQPT